LRAVILAGAGDEWLGCLTEGSPVAALPVAGRPLVALMVDYLERQGITSVVVVSCRWPHLVERSLAARSGQIPVTTVMESPQAGSANAVAKVAAHWGGTFLVAMGDVLSDLDLQSAIEDHKQSGALATVVVCDAEAPCRYGEVGVGRDGAVAMFGSEALVWRGKYRTANSGIFIIEPQLLRHVRQDRSIDLNRELLPQLVEQDQPIRASYQPGYWRGIGSVEQYRQVNLDILQGRVQGVRPEGEEEAPGVWVGADSFIDPGAELMPPVRIGQGCRIEKDAVLGPGAVLGDEVHVRRGAVVTGSVVLERARLGLAAKLENVVAKGNELAGRGSMESTHVEDPNVLERLRPMSVEALVKAAFDRIIGLCALFFLAPLMLLIALLIKLDSAGPVFYSQLRVGEGRRTLAGRYQGRVIEVLKFRTMYQDADRRLKEVLGENEYGSAPFVKIKADPRITRIGQLLRATSLDELPQFINVVRGDMALVGNRPLPLYEAEMLSDEWQQIRFHAPAGITGLWQISGRSDLSAEERMILDNYYAITHSFWTDLKILLVTIPALLARRGAR